MERATGNAEDIADIERLVLEWARAVESKDPEKIVANYGPDTVLFDAIPPARTVGARDIGRIWAQCLPYFPDTFRLEQKDLTIHVDGDLGIVHGMYHFLPEPADDPSGATWFRATIGLRRLPSGWQIMHEHVSIPFDPMTEKAVFLDADANPVKPVTTNGAMPATAASGIQLMPHLVCKGAADAIEFYKQAFGAEEMMRLPVPDGRLLHAAISIGGNVVMLVDEFRDAGEHATSAPSGAATPPVTLHLQVPNVDVSFQQAVAAGAKPLIPPADAFWGDRYGIVEDPFGHRWSLATTVKRMAPQEIEAAAREAMQSASGCGGT